MKLLWSSGLVCYVLYVFFYSPVFKSWLGQVLINVKHYVLVEIKVKHLAE